MSGSRYGPSGPRRGTGGGAASASSATRSSANWTGLPARIEALETEQAELNKQLADPGVYRSKEGGNVAAMHARVEAIDEELMGLLERWETLGGR